MTREIAWTKRATLNLHHAREFIRRDNPAAAVKVGARIEQAVTRLSHFPESGRHGKVPGTRELVLTGLPYVIVYRVGGNAVTILRILHGKQKWPQSS